MQLAVRLAANLLALTWITPVARAAMVAGATLVDLKGKFVIPGLIDSCVHVGLVRDVAQDIKFYTRESVEQQLCIYAAHGVTAVQVLGTDQDTLFDICTDHRKAQPKMARVYTARQGLVFKASHDYRTKFCPVPRWHFQGSRATGISRA